MQGTYVVVVVGGTGHQVAPHSLAFEKKIRAPPGLWLTLVWQDGLAGGRPVDSVRGEPS